MALFVVKTTYITERNEARLAARPAHREWLTKHHAEGTVRNAGPFADESGALLLFEVADRAALDELLATDPYPHDSLHYDVLGEWKHLFAI